MPEKHLKNLVLKLALLGDSAVGKISIINQYIQHRFKEDYVLIGNKIDLKESTAVSTEEGKKLADKMQASDFIETSANLGHNVEKAFRKLVSQVLINIGVDK